MQPLLIPFPGHPPQTSQRLGEIVGGHVPECSRFAQKLRERPQNIFQFRRDLGCRHRRLSVCRNLNYLTFTDPAFAYTPPRLLISREKTAIAQPLSQSQLLLLPNPAFVTTISVKMNRICADTPILAPAESSILQESTAPLLSANHKCCPTRQSDGILSYRTHRVTPSAICFQKQSGHLCTRHSSLALSPSATVALRRLYSSARTSTSNCTLAVSMLRPLSACTTPFYLCQLSPAEGPLAQRLRYCIYY